MLADIVRPLLLKVRQFEELYVDFVLQALALELAVIDNEFLEQGSDHLVLAFLGVSHLELSLIFLNLTQLVTESDDKFLH